MMRQRNAYQLLDSRRLLRGAGQATRSLALAVLGVLAGAPAALAEESLRIQVSFGTDGVAPEALQSEALSLEELKDIRGAGLDAGAPQLDSGSDTAVILFDELGNGRGAGPSKTSSYNSGLGTQMNTSIAGTAN